MNSNGGKSISVPEHMEEAAHPAMESAARRLRIVHVLTHDQVTRGGAVQAMLLAHEQHLCGNEVHLVFNARPDASLHETIKPWVARGLHAQAFEMNRWSEIARFRRLLSKLRPQVVHAHRNDALQFVWLATFGLLRPPALVSQRGTTCDLQTRFVGFIHRSERVHRIIAVAEAVKDSLVRQRVRSDKIRVVYGSFDSDRFDPASVDRFAVRRELGVRDDQALVVQLGQLNTKKAPQMFVRAAALVAERRDDCVFALVGQGRLHAKCRKLAADLRLGSNFHMLGFRSDVPEIYAAADVVVNSSFKDEGLTGALREALAMERPVVATRVSGNPEVVRHGETGLLVEAREPEQMATAIQRLADDREYGRELGRAGGALVREWMSPQVRSNRTEGVYREAIAATGRQTPADLPV